MKNQEQLVKNKLFSDRKVVKSKKQKALFF